MEDYILILVILCLVFLIITMSLAVRSFTSFAKRMNKYEMMIRGLDVNKVKEHQEEIETLYSRINQHYFKVEKNQAELVGKIKEITQSSQDNSTVKSDTTTHNTQMDLLGMKMDDLMNGMRLLRERTDKNSGEEFNRIIKDLYKKIDSLVSIYDRSLITGFNEEHHQKVKNGLKNNIKSLFEDTHSLKNVFLSKETKYNDQQVDQMFNDLLKNISEMEQKIVTDLYHQTQNSAIMNQNHESMEAKIFELHQLMRYLQSKSNEDSEEIKKGLDDILSHISPLQSGLINTLRKSINELQEMTQDTGKDGLSNKLSEDNLLIQESLDALAEYINISQKQLFNIISYNNEKLSKADKSVEESFHVLESKIRATENKLINYLSFIYQSMTTNANNNSVDIGILGKINELGNKIESHSGETKKYFSTIYKQLHTSQEKE